MRCITRHTGYESRSDVFRLYCITDVHLGNLGSNEGLLKELAKKIEADPFAYWIGLGDYCDFINLHDPRFDPRELASWLMGGEELADIGRAEVRRFVDIMRPVADKCLGLCEGNHESKFLQHSEADVYAAIVDGLQSTDAHRLDHRGFISWRFSRQGGSTWTLRILASHGSGGGSSKGNAANKAGKLAEMADGVDVILMGHLHAPSHTPISKLRPGRTKAERTTIHTVSCPALCGDMKYADDKDLPAMPVGYAMLQIRPNDKQVDVTISVS